MTVPTFHVHNTPSILNSGMPYIYRLTPKNGVGYSLSKCSYTMNADLIPQTCNSPTIDIPDIHPQKVTIKWAPIDSALNGGDNVVFYLLEWN